MRGFPVRYLFLAVIISGQFLAFAGLIYGMHAG